MSFYKKIGMCVLLLSLVNSTIQAFGNTDVIEKPENTSLGVEEIASPKSEPRTLAHLKHHWEKYVVAVVVLTVSAYALSRFLKSEPASDSSARPRHPASGKQDPSEQDLSIPVGDIDESSQQTPTSTQTVRPITSTQNAATTTKAQPQLQLQPQPKIALALPHTATQAPPPPTGQKSTHQQNEPKFKGIPQYFSPEVSSIPPQELVGHIKAFPSLLAKMPQEARKALTPVQVDAIVGDLDTRTSLKSLDKDAFNQVISPLYIYSKTYEFSTRFDQWKILGTNGVEQVNDIQDLLPLARIKDLTDEQWKAFTTNQRAFSRLLQTEGLDQDQETFERILKTRLTDDGPNQNYGYPNFNLIKIRSAEENTKSPLELVLTPTRLQALSPEIRAGLTPEQYAFLSEQDGYKEVFDAQMFRDVFTPEKLKRMYFGNEIGMREDQKTRERESILKGIQYLTVEQVSVLRFDQINSILTYNREKIIASFQKPVLNAILATYIQAMKKPPKKDEDKVEDLLFGINIATLKLMLKHAGDEISPENLGALDADLQAKLQALPD